jgi:hypothetical protein
MLKNKIDLYQKRYDADLVSNIMQIKNYLLVKPPPMAPIVIPYPFLKRGFLSIAKNKNQA